MTAQRPSPLCHTHNCFPGQVWKILGTAPEDEGWWQGGRDHTGPSSGTRATAGCTHRAILDCDLGFVERQKTQSGLLRVPDTRGSLLGCRHIRDRLGVHSWPQAVFVLRTSGLQKHLS